MSISCDLFCSVVDNLGDAAVCWRLARQLSAEHDWQVRLWIDDSKPLAMLRPGFDPGLAQQTIDAVEIRHWTRQFPEVVPGDVVIEAFACELPESFLDAMSARSPRPVWINLEYLSAEDWVVGCHGLCSPHPRLPLVKHFFFPGFVPGTGGLLHERDFVPLPEPASPALKVSLFCYDNPALPALLTAWTSEPTPIRLLVADGLPRLQVETWLGTPFPPGTEMTCGSLHLEASPFLSQPDYDRLLGSCRINFVRGEDSFVRAQWAERPFVWQIYPQAEGSHLDKLDAFLRIYCEGLPEASRAATCKFWRAWNGQGDVASAWAGFRTVLPALQTHAGPWATGIARPGDLAGNLANFCLNRI